MAGYPVSGNLWISGRISESGFSKPGYPGIRYPGSKSVSGTTLIICKPIAPISSIFKVRGLQSWTNLKEKEIFWENIRVVPDTDFEPGYRIPGYPGFENPDSNIRPDIRRLPDTGYPAGYPVGYPVFSIGFLIFFTCIHEVKNIFLITLLICLKTLL